LPCHHDVHCPADETERLQRRQGDDRTCGSQETAAGQGTCWHGEIHIGPNDRSIIAEPRTLAKQVAGV
jgi:hypothetical protein